MSITAKFYKITDDARVINKTLPTSVDKSVTIKGVDSVLSPTIMLHYDSGIVDKNYVYLPAPYNRYYFLAPPVLSPGKRIAFSCSVDPLMSNRADIDKLSVLISRMQRAQYSGSESDFIDDNRAQALMQPNVHTIAASTTPFKKHYAGTAADPGWTYVLTVVGGVKNDT